MPNRGEILATQKDIQDILGVQVDFRAGPNILEGDHTLCCVERGTLGTADFVQPFQSQSLPLTSIHSRVA